MHVREPVDADRGGQAEEHERGVETREHRDAGGQQEQDPPTRTGAARRDFHALTVINPPGASHGTEVPDAAGSVCVDTDDMSSSRLSHAERTLAAASRVDLLHLLQRGGTHTVGDLARATGLHENTTREHLARLVHDGYAVREPETRTVRGRPRMLYRATSPQDARRDPAARGRLEDAIAHVALTKALIGGFGRDVGPTRDAARSAGRALTGPGGSLEPSVPGTRDGLTEQAVEGRQLDALEGHLDRLGFDPERDDAALRIDLWRCPFLDLARERPDVVCSVHLGLAVGVLETAGGPIVAERLRPFVGHDHCVLELARTPADPPGPATPPE